MRRNLPDIAINGGRIGPVCLNSDNGKPMLFDQSPRDRSPRRVKLGRPV
jgi:hypothetical protein